MLTDMTWLAAGMDWPPKDRDEKDRLSEHRRNRAIYNGQHDLVFSKYAQYLKDRALMEKKLVVILDWPRNATSKMMSLCLGDAPDIMVDNADDNLSAAVDKLAPVMNEVGVDWSRYGIGLVEIGRDAQGLPRVESWNPENVLIVCTRGDIRTVTQYVLHFYFTVGQRTYLKIKIHEPGKVTHQLWEIADARQEKQNPTISGVYANTYGSMANPQAPGAAVLRQIVMNGFLRGPLPLETFFAADGMSGTSFVVETGLSGFAVVPVHNQLTSERYYGRSDYGPDVQSLLEGLELAFARRQETIAIHARPTDIVPETACSFDHALQQWIYKSGETIVYGEKDNPAAIKKLTWDAQQPMVKDQIDDMMNQLISALDLAHELIAEQSTSGGGKAASGAALRLRLIPTLTKVKRLRSALHVAMVEIITDLGEMYGDSIDKDDINIQWNDGIPEDPLESANTRSINAGTLTNLKVAGVLDTETVLRLAVSMKVLDLDDPDSDIPDILAKLEEEAAGAIPMALPPAPAAAAGGVQPGGQPPQLGPNGRPMPPGVIQNGGQMDSESNQASGLVAGGTQRKGGR